MQSILGTINAGTRALSQAHNRTQTQTTHTDNMTNTYKTVPVHIQFDKRTCQQTKRVRDQHKLRSTCIYALAM